MSYSDTADDLNRKYGRSIILYKGEPTMIEGFDQDEDKVIKVTFLVHNEKKFRTELWNPENFREQLIPHGFYNLHKPIQKGIPTAYVYLRQPRRQYRRGICHDNSELLSVFGAVNGKLGVYGGGGAAYIDNFDAINNMYNPWYPTDIWHAIALTKECGSVALCPEYALTVCPATSEGILLVNRNSHFIGELESNCIKVHFKPFLQEVQDVVRRRNINATVIGAS